MRSCAYESKMLSVRIWCRQGKIYLGERMMTYEV